MSAEILEQAFASTGAVLANVDSAQMDGPTPCRSWTVRDLVNHVVGGTTFFAAVADTGVPPQRQPTDYTAGEFKTEFATGSARAVAAFRAPGVMERVMKLPFGELPGERFVWVAAIDTFTHGWDLARATGQSSDLNPALAERLLAVARMSLPDALRGPDGQAAFGPAVAVADDAPAADRLAGFMGRPV